MFDARGKLHAAASPGDPDDPFTEDPFAGDNDESIIGIQADQFETIDKPVSRSISRQVPIVFSNVDPFANINSCTPDHLERLAKILEIRGAQPRQIKMREACFSAAGVTEGTSVLEIGCGTGVVTRQLAKIAGRHGRVVGADVSPALLDYARTLSPPDGTSIEYTLADAGQLPFQAREFDASCSITLFAHLTDLDRMVREMIRVTSKTVMVLDQDYQTLVFENSDTHLTRKILQHGSDYNVLDGWCGRKLAGLLVRNGVEHVQCWPFVYAERDAESYLITIAERFAALATRDGVVTDKEGRVWLQELYDRAVEGTFYASLNYYFAFGTVKS